MSLLDNIFVNWRIVSKIPEGGRLSTTNGSGQISLEEDNSYFTSFWRSITGDSRSKTAKFLAKLMNDTIEISDNMINSLLVSKNLAKKSSMTSSQIDVDIYKINEYNKKLEQLGKLSRELRNSKKGIANLHVTYEDDANITSKLEEVIDKIETQTNKIERSLKIINN